MGNPKIFIGNAVFFTGEYEKPIICNPKPKVSNITARVYPRLIAVLDRNEIASKV
jgi:hypothetical protein